MKEFIISSPDQFFSEVVRPQYQRFVQNNSDVGVAVCAIIVSYHMYEWATGRKFQKEEFPKEYPGEEGVSVYLDLARNMSNSTKHAKMKIRSKKQAGFSSAFNEGFSRPLMIICDDETV